MIYRKTLQVSYDGFKSPGSQNQRCRSEKYLLNVCTKQRKYIFCFGTEKNCYRLQWMTGSEQFVRLLSGRNDAIAP